MWEVQVNEEEEMIDDVIEPKIKRSPYQPTQDDIDDHEGFDDHGRRDDDVD